jgi:hypothetical protein
MSGPAPFSDNKKRRKSGVSFLEMASRYLIFASLNSTCLRATGSYFFIEIFSVFVREFFFVT